MVHVLIRSSEWRWRGGHLFSLKTVLLVLVISPGNINCGAN